MVEVEKKVKKIFCVHKKSQSVILLNSRDVKNDENNNDYWTFSNIYIYI